MWGHVFNAIGVGFAIAGIGLAVVGAGPYLTLGFATISAVVTIIGVSCAYSSYCH